MRPAHIRFRRNKRNCKKNSIYRWTVKNHDDYYQRRRVIRMGGHVSLSCTHMWIWQLKTYIVGLTHNDMLLNSLSAYSWLHSANVRLLCVRRLQRDSHVVIILKCEIFPIPYWKISGLEIRKLADIEVRWLFNIHFW